MLGWESCGDRIPPRVVLLHGQSYDTYDKAAVKASQQTSRLVDPRGKHT